MVTVSDILKSFAIENAFCLICNVFWTGLFHRNSVETQKLWFFHDFDKIPWMCTHHQTGSRAQVDLYMKMQSSCLIVMSDPRVLSFVNFGGIDEFDIAHLTWDLKSFLCDLPCTVEPVNRWSVDQTSKQYHCRRK